MISIWRKTPGIHSRNPLQESTPGIHSRNPLCLQIESKLASSEYLKNISYRRQSIGYAISNQLVAPFRSYKYEPSS